MSEERVWNQWSPTDHEAQVAAEAAEQLADEAQDETVDVSVLDHGEALPVEKPAAPKPKRTKSK